MNIISLPADRFSDPGLVVKVDSPFLLRIASYIGHCLQVPGLGLKPLVYEQLRVLGETEEEFSAGLEAVNGLHRLVYLVVQGLYFLLRRGRQQKIVHLCFQRVIDLLYKKK